MVAKASATAQGARRGRGHWILLGCSFAAVLFLTALRLFTTPDASGHGTHEQLGLPPCTLMQLTGFPCPGCGVTTAMSYLARGQWRAAIIAQPFGALLALGSVAVCAWTLFETARGNDAWASFRRFWKPWMSWCLGCAMMAAWAYKIAVLRA